MIKKWLSRYNLRYPQSLVYMLQVSEYNVKDYLVWYHRVTDFTRIERRKSFVKTTKGLLLLIIAWIIVFILLIIAISIALGTTPLRYLYAFFILLAIPYFLTYFLILPLLVIHFLIQWPIETFIINKARQKLKNCKALKIAVAGSFGKTTMREILKTVLLEKKKVAAPPHSYNTPLGISRFVKTLKGDEEILIFELGEYYPGDVKKLCNLTQPDMGIITGINEAHLQKFKTLERTTKTIYELADYLNDKLVYINGENQLARDNAQTKHIIYNRNQINNWKIKNQKTNLKGTSFTMAKNDLEIDLKSDLLGLHQIGPLATAVEIALGIGLSPNQIKEGVSKIKPFDHRLEPKINNGVIIIDDSYNGNPDGVRVVIEFLNLLKDRRRFYVTPGLVEMGKKTSEIHKQIGRDLAKAEIENIILIKNSVTNYIEEGLKEKEYKGKILWFDDALKAFSALQHITVEGDVVLLQNDWPDQYQ